MKSGVLIIRLICITLVITSCNAGIQGFPDRTETSNAEWPVADSLLGPDSLKRYNLAENDQKKQKEIRNNIIEARIVEIDDNFGKFQRELFKQGVSIGIGSDWLQTALSAATGIVGGASTKAALGILGGGVKSATESYDKRLLFSRTLEALIITMVVEREVIRSEIRQNEGKEVSEYNVYAALSDLTRYDFAGSIPGALQAISSKAGETLTKLKAGKKQRNIFPNQQILNYLLYFYLRGIKMMKPFNKRSKLREIRPETIKFE